MPITGKFVADFGSFLDAVDQSNLKLVDFGKGASTVEARLNSMVDNFSGRKLIQEASLMSIAIEAAGGVSALTASQLQTVGAKSEEAAEKLRKLGYDVPVGIQHVADAMHAANESTSGWLPLLRDLGSSWVARIAEGVLLRDAVNEVIGKIKEMAEALPELALKGAAVAEIEESFKRLTDQSGLLGEKLLGTLRSATHDTITDFELMKTVNKDLAAGLELTDAQFGTLAAGAFALAKATGVDVKTALDTMNDAMLTGRTRSLALLTGKIDVTAAEEKFAQALGKSRDNLTEAGKLEAGRAAILEAVTSATQRLGAQTDGLDERVSQANVAWSNFEENLGKAIATSAVLTAGIDGIRQILIDAFGDSQQAIVAGITQKVEQAEIGVIRFGASGVEVAGFLVKEFIATEKVFGDVAQALEIANLAAEKFERFKVQSSDILGIDPQSQALLKELNIAIDASTASILRRGEALQADDKLQVEVDATTAKYVARLEELRAKMQAAADGQSAFVGPIQGEAKAFDAAGVAVGKHVDGLLKLDDADKKLAEAFAELAAAGDGWRGTLDGLDGAVVEGIKGYLDAGVAQDKLALVYGVTAVQVKAVASELKEETAELKRGQEAILETSKLWDEYDTLRAAHGGTATDKQIADIDRWAADLTAKMQKAGTDTAEFYDALTHVTSERLNAVGVNWAALTDAATRGSKAGLQEIADGARRTYAIALTHVGEWSAGTIEKFHETAIAAQAAADGWDSSFTGALDKVSQVASGANTQMSNLRNTITLTAKDMSDLNNQLHSFYDAIAAQGPIGNFSGPSAQTLRPLPGHASGIENAAEGHWAVVGENGPEMMYVPRGATIRATESSGSAGAFGGGGGGGAQTIQLIVDGRVLAEVVNNQTMQDQNRERLWPLR